MNKNLIITTVIGCFLSACTLSDKSNSDVQCKIIEDKAGNTIKEYDFISLTYTLKTPEGKVLASSGHFDKRPLLLFRTRPYFIGDLNTALGKLSEGDSAVIRINLDSMRVKMHYHLPAGTKGKYLSYEVRINKVITRGSMDDQTLNQKFEELKQSEVEQAKMSEAKKISAYVDAKHLHPQSTASGLRYTLATVTNKKRANTGDTVLVNYKISSLDGKVFETNYKEIAKQAGIFYAQGSYKPFRIVAGKKAGSGFNEAASLFGKGAKATVIMPSEIAYGIYGSRSIEPYTPLLYEIEIVDIIPWKKAV